MQYWFNFCVSGYKSYSWVSGVSSLRHPVVWTACVAYINSTALSDRVWGEGGSFVTLVYLEGSSQPVFSQCTCDVEDVDHDSTSFKMACGESALQVCGD